MKKYLMGVIFSSALLGCKYSNEYKAKVLIADYIKENANDPESYEPVEFDKIDTLKSSYTYIPSFNENNEKFIDARISQKRYNFVRDSLMSNNKPEFSGFMMRHKFRAKNGFGAKILNSKVFYFDKELSKVDSSADTLD